VFGDRIANFVQSFRLRPEEVCDSPRLVKLASDWAGCNCNHRDLQAQLTAWKKLLSWFAMFDPRRGCTIPFAGYWRPSEESAFAELRLILRDIVPDSERAATRLRHNIATSILNTYREKGWLPKPKKGLLSGFTRIEDALLETIKELCK
jgi:hypothetical protein